MSQMHPLDPLSDYKLPYVRFTCAFQLLNVRVPPEGLICLDGGDLEYTHQVGVLLTEELLKEDYHDLAN
jgi:hypothetical protein